MRRPIDPKSQYTLWAQAISYLSMTLRLEVRPFGPPGEERNAHSLVWKTDAWVEDEDNPEYGWPEFYVCLTMLEGDPERLTISIRCKISKCCVGSAISATIRIGNSWAHDVVVEGLARICWRRAACSSTSASPSSSSLEPSSLSCTSASMLHCRSRTKAHHLVCPFGPGNSFRPGEQLIGLRARNQPEVAGDRSGVLVQV